MIDTAGLRVPYCKYFNASIKNIAVHIRHCPHCTYSVFEIEEVSRSHVCKNRLEIKQQVEKSYSQSMGRLLTVNVLLVLLAVSGEFKQL